jgi:hypothetical protein
MELGTKHQTSRESATITPGELRLKPISEYAFQNVDAITALTKIRKTTPSVQVPMKTFGPDQGELHYNDGSGSIGRLNDIMVTLIRLTNPNTGFVSIEMSLEYFATSDGSRTPDGRALPGSTTYYNAGHESYKVNHSVYFRNATGGLVYTWWVGQDFQLDCGWNRRHCLHGKIETNILGWFDAVERYNWDVSGLFYRC